MDSSTHQNNMQFDKFYRDASRFTTNSILAIIGLLFIAISSVFLLVSYWCLTGSEYIETFKRDYERQYDYVNIQETLIGFMKASKDKIYYYFNMFYENNLFIKQEQMEDDSSGNKSDIEEEDDSSDNDVEDVTEKTLLEKEMNKIIVDLSSEDILHTLEPLNELGANVMEDIIAEMKNPEFIEKKECIEDDDTEDDAEDDDVEDDDTEDDDADDDAEDDDTEDVDAEDVDTDDEDADAEDAEEDDDVEKREVIYYEPPERTLRSTKKKVKEVIE